VQVTVKRSWTESFKTNNTQSCWQQADVDIRKLYEHVGARRRCGRANANGMIAMVGDTESGMVYRISLSGCGGEREAIPTKLLCKKKPATHSVDGVVGRQTRSVLCFGCCCGHWCHAGACERLSTRRSPGAVGKIIHYGDDHTSHWSVV
jgi:hypothetical protein